MRVQGPGSNDIEQSEWRFSGGMVPPPPKKKVDINRPIKECASLQQHVQHNGVHTWLHACIEGDLVLKTPPSSKRDWLLVSSFFFIGKQEIVIALQTHGHVGIGLSIVVASFSPFLLDSHSELAPTNTPRRMDDV